MRASKFGSITNLLTSFLQNLIGNILNFNTIYQNIVNANNAGKIADVYFFIGRLSYLIVYFNPIEEAGYIPLQEFSVPHDPVSFLLEQSSDRRPPRIQPVYNTAKADGLTIAYDLTINFFNSSIGISSPNSTVCVGNITAI